jgi:hypothetical protein
MPLAQLGRPKSVDDDWVKKYHKRWSRSDFMTETVMIFFVMMLRESGRDSFVTGLLCAFTAKAEKKSPQQLHTHTIHGQKRGSNARTVFEQRANIVRTTNDFVRTE